MFEEYFLETHPSQNIFWTTHCQLYLKNMLNHSLKIVVEEYFLQIHPSRNICWITYFKLFLKNISYRPTHPRKYVETLIVNCAWRIFPTDPSIPEYMLNRSLSIVFEEYFLQTHPSQNICWTAHCQLCLKNISYRPIHPRIYVEPVIVNCVWRIFPTDPSTPEYMLNCSLSIVFEEYFLETHPSQNIFWTIHWQLWLKNISYRSIHPRIYVESLIVNCVWRIFPTDPSIPEYMLNRSLSIVWRIFPTDPSIQENMLNRSLLIVLEEYSLRTHPSQNICWTTHCQLCLKNISYRPIHPRIYVEPLIVNYVWRIFPTDPSIPEYNMLNHSLSIVFEEYSLQTRPNGT